MIPLAPLADLLRQVRRSRPDLLTDAPDLEPLQHWYAPTREESESAEAPRGGLFAAVLELVTRLAADDAVVVGFEDLHWADTVTWNLFEFLARNLIDERVVLVGTYRANEVGIHPSQRRRMAELSRLPAAHPIHLEGLDRDDVAARIAALIGEPAANALVDQIVARGQGNPFFTRELVSAHLAGETIPMVLSDLISAEIAGLDDVPRQVLEAVATIGRETGHELLAAVVALPDTEVEAAVRTVVDARLLVVDNDAYHFRHPLLGEVVYADLLPPRRMRLHRRVAEALQQQPTERLRRADRQGSSPSTSTGQATSRARSRPCWRRPMRRRRSRRVLRSDTSSVRSSSGIRSAKAAEHVNRGDRLWQAADLATSTVGNQRALELARAAFEFGPPPLGTPFGHERLGRYLWSTGQLRESRLEFDLAAGLLSGDEGVEAALMLAGLGQAELMSANYESAEHWCARVFDLVPTPDDNRAAWVMARRVLGVVRSNQGYPDQAVEHCREAVAAANNAQAHALATLYLCVALIDAGDNQAAINAALDAVAEGQRTGLDQGFGGYFDSLAAEALNPTRPVVRGRPWSLATPFRTRSLRACFEWREPGRCRARRGETERALRLLAEGRVATRRWMASVGT